MKASAVNGSVERDASGNTVIYYDDQTAKGLGFSNGYADGISLENVIGIDGSGRN